MMGIKKEKNKAKLVIHTNDERARLANLGKGQNLGGPGVLIVVGVVVGVLADQFLRPGAAGWHHRLHKLHESLAVALSRD